MSRKLDKRVDEVMRYQNQGLSPGDIAATLDVDAETVAQWLCIAVGEEKTSGTAVFLSIPSPIRETYRKAIEAVGRNPVAIRRWLGRNAPTVTDSEIPAFLTFEGRLRPDTYRLIARLEEIFHQRIKAGLVNRFGAAEDGWWRQGIPEKIRINCQARREQESRQPSEHPYNYTMLMDLKEIFDSKWAILCDELPPKAKADKKKFMEGLRELNDIRNRVMHSSRCSPPTEDDFRQLVAFMMFLAGYEPEATPSVVVH